MFNDGVIFIDVCDIILVVYVILIECIMCFKIV